MIKLLFKYYESLEPVGPVGPVVPVGPVGPVALGDKWHIRLFPINIRVCIN